MSAAGKTGLVTGAGSGIGRAIALEMAELGFDRLVLMGRRETPLRELAEGLAARGVEGLVRPVDLAAREPLDATLSELLEETPRFDAVVHSAGQSALTPLEGARVSAFRALLEIDLVAALRLLRALLPRVAEGGRVLLVSSILSRIGIPELHAYCAAKAGLDGLARALALDAAPRRITVNALRPGWVETEMARDAIRMQAPGLGKDEATAREDFERAVPLRRFLRPEEVAAAARWLLSEDAALVTGQGIDLCGGATA